MGADGNAAARRTYDMGRRAQAAAATRRRIVDATVELHGERGPAQATIAEIAERAGVSRVTVYRHFPDDVALFGACSAAWASQQQEPDPAAWAAVDDLGDRLRTGLADLYRYYRDGEQMLTGVHRDREQLPAPIRSHLDQEQERWVEALLGGPEGTTATQRRRRALVGHAASFTTWRSLCVEQGLSRAEAVEAMVHLVLEAP